MTDLLWSRRSFLKLAATAAGAALLAPTQVLSATPNGMLLDTSFNAFGGIVRWTDKILLSAINAEVVSADGAMFSIGRSEQEPLLMMPLMGRSWFRWVSLPGAELALGNGFVNLSDADVRILSLDLRQNGHGYFWAPERGITPFDATAPPLHVEPFIEAPALVA